MHLADIVLLVEKQVCRLYVTVDDAVGMQVVDALNDPLLAIVIKF